MDPESSPIASGTADGALKVPSSAHAGAESTFTERWIPRGVHTLYARDYPGAGPAFLMLHGFPDNLHIYDEVAEIMSVGGRRVVTFDFLGYGKSDKPEGFAYSFSEQLEDVGIVADALELGTFVMVPHDAGGPAGINYALSNPSRISSLAILNGFYHPTPLLRFPELIQIFSNPELAPLAAALVSDPVQLGWLLKFQMRQFQTNLTPAQKARFEAVLQPLIEANFFAQGSGPAFVAMTADTRAIGSYNAQRLNLMHHFPKPVHLFWGVADPYANDAVGRELAAQFPHATFFPLPAGHWLQIDAPTDLARLMLANN